LHYPKENRPGHAIKQLLKFTYSISKGDIILIPSKNSDHISFGEVIETPAYIDNSSIDTCLFRKRKKVKWLKTIDRNNLDPRLFRLMFSHHTVTEGDSYAEQIDKELASFFIKGDRAHMILEVKTLAQIKAVNLFQLGLLPLQIFDEFCKDENYDYSSEDFQVKLDVQSPGFIELSGEMISGIIILGMIFIAIAGGGFNIKYKELNVGINSDGIMEKINNFLRTNSNVKAKRQIIESIVKDLEIKDPKELKDLLKELNK